MGEVKQKIELENYVDRVLADEAKIKNGEVRKVTIDALVDTGATLMLLPQEIVELLGLKVSRKVIVSYADNRKDERDVAGVAIIKIGDRLTNANCIVGPPNSEPLIGQVILEELDLIVDLKEQKLIPRPESPYLPLLNLK